VAERENPLRFRLSPSIFTHARERARGLALVESLIVSGTPEDALKIRAHAQDRGIARLRRAVMK